MDTQKIPIPESEFVMKLCPVCGNIFDTRLRNKDTCSDECEKILLTHKS